MGVALKGGKGAAVWDPVTRRNPRQRVTAADVAVIMPVQSMTEFCVFFFFYEV